MNNRDLILRHVRPVLGFVRLNYNTFSASVPDTGVMEAYVEIYCLFSCFKL